MKKIVAAATAGVAFSLGASAPHPDALHDWHIGTDVWTVTAEGDDCLVRRGGTLHRLEGGFDMLYMRRDLAARYSSECKTGDRVQIRPADAYIQERTYREQVAELTGILATGQGVAPQHETHRWVEPISTSPESAFRPAGEDCIPHDYAITVSLGTLSTGESVISSEPPRKSEFQPNMCGRVVFLMGPDGTPSS